MTFDVKAARRAAAFNADNPSARREARERLLAACDEIERLRNALVSFGKIVGRRNAEVERLREELAKEPKWPDDFKRFGTNVKPKKQK